MKTYPIIFSGPMVTALLAGRKVQTRRLPTTMWAKLKMHHEMGTPCALWARENIWQTCRYVNDSHVESGCSDMQRQWLDRCAYHADGGSRPDDMESRPSIHMPRWASRLTLEVTDVRLQRLQDVSESDAVAEGASSKPKYHGFGHQDDGWSMDWSNVGTPSRWGTNGILTERDVCLGSARSAFGAFINQLHGGPRWNCKPEAPLWDQNPEVYAISFRVHRQNIDQFVKEAA